MNRSPLVGRGRTPRVLISLLALLAAAGCSGTLPWTSDMVETPARHADEGLLMPPEGSLSTTGEVTQSRFQAAMSLRNPLSDDADSLASGERLFEIYCQPCHGTAGQGDGKVASYFTLRPPADLTGTKVRNQTDGYIYATIRDGGGSMPPLGGSLSRTERWAVVMYLRSLQQ